MSCSLFYVYSWSNLCSDWLTVKGIILSMPMGRLQACKDRAKSHIINNFWTLNIRSLQKFIKPWPCHIDLAIALSIQHGHCLRFSHKDVANLLYLIAIGTHARRLVTAILVIPTLAADKAPSAAPNLLFGSLNGVTYSPAGVTSAVLFPSCLSFPLEYELC